MFAYHVCMVDLQRFNFFSSETSQLFHNIPHLSDILSLPSPYPPHSAQCKYSFIPSYVLIFSFFCLVLSFFFYFWFLFLFFSPVLHPSITSSCLTYPIFHPIITSLFSPFSPSPLLPFSFSPFTPFSFFPFSPFTLFSFPLLLLPLSSFPYHQPHKWFYLLMFPRKKESFEIKCIWEICKWFKFSQNMHANYPGLNHAPNIFLKCKIYFCNSFRKKWLRKHNWKYQRTQFFIISLFLIFLIFRNPHSIYAIQVYFLYSLIYPILSSE